MWRHRGGDEAYVGEGGTQRGEEACRDIILGRRHAEALQGERRHAEASLQRGGSASIVGERRRCKHHAEGEEACGGTHREKRCLEALKLKSGGMWSIVEAPLEEGCASVKGKVRHVEVVNKGRGGIWRYQGRRMWG